MEELKLLIGMVTDLPALATWVLVGFLVYKIAVIGSVYGVIRLGITQLFGWLQKKEDRRNNPPPVELRGAIDGMCITADGSHNQLVAQIMRICGKDTGATRSLYIHKQSVQWLREAIDAKELLDAEKGAAK
jgi:hypothetical protein